MVRGLRIDEGWRRLSYKGLRVQQADFREFLAPLPLAMVDTPKGRHFRVLGQERRSPCPPCAVLYLLCIHFQTDGTGQKRITQNFGGGEKSASQLRFGQFWADSACPQLGLRIWCPRGRGGSSPPFAPAFHRLFQQFNESVFWPCRVMGTHTVRPADALLASRGPSGEFL